jgi:hypothetical protein
MTIIEKYSDYSIQTINYFITHIEDAINSRDIHNLTNGKIDIIRITKEHPLVTMMASQLGQSRSAELLRSNILPAIAVTPGNADNQDFGMGLTMSEYKIDDDRIAELRVVYNLPNNASIQSQGLITKQQIENIMAQYKRRGNNTLKCHVNQWGREEEVNISCWSESQDVDFIMDNIVNSVLADLRAKFPGDESPLRNMKYKTTRGLTNFNFGRVLFGSEYNLTFLNIYNNYTVFMEEDITDFEADLSYTTPGEE